MHFDFGKKRNEEIYEKEYEKFKEKLKKKLSRDYNISPNEIVVTYPQKGSLNVQVIFQRDDFNNLNVDEFKEKFENEKDFEELKNLKEIHNYGVFVACKLAKKMLDSKGNRINGWGKNETRGGMEYFPPEGWIGIGLKVLDNYDDGNNEWIDYRHPKGEWCVAYHGVGRGQDSKQVESITGKIIYGGFKPGEKQYHENCKNINKKNKNYNGKKVGKGVYCTPKISTAESYSGISEINGKKYYTVLMVRVNPNKMRYCADEKDYWVVDGTADTIRPYRILYKKA